MKTTAVVAVVAVFSLSGVVVAQATHRHERAPDSGEGFEVEVDRPLVTLGDEVEVTAEYKVNQESESEGETGAPPPREEPPQEEPPTDEPPTDEPPTDEPPVRAPAPGSSLPATVSFSVDYGDGTVEDLAADELEVDDEEFETEATGAHTYAAAGNYTVTVTAVPDVGEAQTASVDLTVTTEPVPYPRPGRFACPEGQVPGAGFRDVARTSPHDLAVDCLVAKGVVNGIGPGTFAPSASLNRGQMASLLVRSIELSGGTLSVGADMFRDDNGSVHETNINKLALAGLVNGADARSFAPEAPLTRAQMASLLVRAYQFQAGSLPAAAADYFADDAASVHQDNINLAAAAGFAGGTDLRSFAPGRDVTREQISTFLVRMIDLLTEEGLIS